MVGNISGEVDLSNRVLDTQKVPVDEDMQYTVFVSYVRGVRCNRSLPLKNDNCIFLRGLVIYLF